MWHKSLTILVVLFCTLMLFPGSSWALCDQADLEGTWDVEVWGGCPSGTQCWDQCTLTIASDGSIQAAGTYTDCFGATSNITGGQLAVYPGCEIQGTIITSNGTIDVGPGGFIGEKLVLGTE